MMITHISMTFQDADSLHHCDINHIKETKFAAGNDNRMEGEGIDGPGDMVQLFHRRILRRLLVSQILMNSEADKLEIDSHSAH